jgi:hypothetical protein
MTRGKSANKYTFTNVCRACFIFSLKTEVYCRKYGQTLSFNSILELKTFALSITQFEGNIAIIREALILLDYFTTRYDRNQYASKWHD